MEALSDKGYFSMGNVKSMAEDGIYAYIRKAKHGMPKPNSMNPDSYTTARRISI